MFTKSQSFDRRINLGGDYMKNICDNCKFWKNPKTRGTMQFWYGDCLNKKSDRYETKTDEFFSCNYFEERQWTVKNSVICR